MIPVNGYLSTRTVKTQSRSGDNYRLNTEIMRLANVSRSAITVTK